jgi:type I restriction enzyme R subunit
VFSSNGDGFVFHDGTRSGGDIECNLQLHEFPSPHDLWARYREWKGLPLEAEALLLQDYYSTGKEPRYYQETAVNAAIEAIAKDQKRLLLVMATGTGKTYTAFQIIWRLWKAGRKKRILFLADRNVLINQTMVNDFRPFGAAMAKLSTSSKVIEREDGTEVALPIAIDKKRRIDTSYEIYLALYQAITGKEEREKLFKELSPDFFDLIVVDECHRGSADEDSAWREILEYFSSATQIGMTATPKETRYISNIDVINKINDVDFNDLAEKKHFGEIYEQILNDLQSAGNAGEDYTPRAVTAFMAERIDPRPGEVLLDPACGTGGFLTCWRRDRIRVEGHR